jgi:pyridinium-3,5-bisthiocarboxylic acid mononucleotide nickel chelatase
LLEAGALDAWAAPITMKKGRPAIALGAIATAADRTRIAQVMLAETTTLGVRHYAIERDVLAREPVTVKTA